MNISQDQTNKISLLTKETLKACNVLRKKKYELIEDSRKGSEMMMIKTTHY